MLIGFRGYKVHLVLIGCHGYKVHFVLIGCHDYRFYLAPDPGLLEL